jgi:hypothetical protein
VLRANGNGINISPMGRSEAVGQTQPAGCTLQLDNRVGAYSRGPQSSNYPNVKLNVPFRVRIALDGVSANGVVRFQGYVHQLKPGWDETGSWAVIDLAAAGAMRRMLQGVPPERSPLYREALKNLAAGYVIGSWSMEDPIGSQSFSSIVEASRPMRYFGSIQLANDSTLIGSKPLPTFNADTGITAYIPKGLPGTQFQIDWHHFSIVTPAADTVFLIVDFTGGTASRWELAYPSGSTTTVKFTAYDAAGGVLSTLTSVPPVTGGLINNGMLHWTLTGRQNGANVEWLRYVTPMLGGTGGSATSTYVGTVGTPYQIRINPTANLAGAVMGHVLVTNQYAVGFQLQAEDAWIYEDADDRITRLAGEDDIPIVVTGTSDTSMGYQPIASILPLLRDTEAADLGTLGDGLGPGFYYVSRLGRYNQAVALTLAADGNQLVEPFEPTDDDQDIVNSASVSRQGGSTAVFEDVDGPLGTESIFTYGSASTVNITEDDELLSYAGWLVHLGTADGYRYPSVSMIVNKIPSKAADVLALMPTGLVQITGISNYVTQHPAPTIELLVEGWTERLTNTEWTISLNCSPAQVWGVGTLGAATGAVVDPVARLDVIPGTCTLNSAALLGATSLSVASSGVGSALWSTRSADYPLTISVKGYPVTVSAVSGASSPQTFTVSALPVAAASGTEIGLYQPSVLGL